LQRIKIFRRSRLRNLRYSRLRSLRYFGCGFADSRIHTQPIWKSAIPQVGKPALRVFCLSKIFVEPAWTRIMVARIEFVFEAAATQFISAFFAAKLTRWISGQMMDA